jgi:hypothetical protein
MRIGRLDVGLWTRPKGNYTWRDWLTFFRTKACCGCLIVQVGRVDVTWLAGDCYEYAKNPSQDPPASS